MFGHQKRVRNSCLKCRHRKIRCTRERPQCQNCLRYGQECKYEVHQPQSAPGNTPNATTASASTATRLDPGIGRSFLTAPRNGDDEVLERLARLEQTVAKLVASSDSASQSMPYERESSADIEDGSPRSSTLVRSRNTSKLCNVVIVDGEPQYRTDLYWGQMMEQTELLDLSDSDEAAPGPSFLSSLLFAPPHASFALEEYLPNTHEAEWLYAVFCLRVDPIARVLHKPTFEKEMREYFLVDSSNHEAPAPSPGQRSKARLRAGFEALLFAVFYAAVYSMTTEEFVEATFGGSVRGSGIPTLTTKPRVPTSQPPEALRLDCLQRFQYASCQCLLRAHIFEKQNLPSVMAMFLLLFTACQETDIPSLYTLVGMLMRISRSLGLHIDPKALGTFTQAGKQPLNGSERVMTPILIDTRRRLWYHVLHLDMMACEAHGVDPESISAAKVWPDGISTSLPSNVEDVEIPEDAIDSANWPNLPEDRGKFTEMSMQLVRFNVSLCFRQLTSILCSYTKVPVNGAAETLVMTELKNCIESMVERNEKLYLRYCEKSDPIQNMTLVLGKMAEHKAWLLYYHRVSNIFPSEDPSEKWTHSRHRALSTATELIRMYATILSHPPAQPFRWHTSRHSQLHAILHVLGELCTTDPRTASEERRDICKQAWAALESLQITPESWNQREVKSSENLNKKLQHLKERARAIWSNDNPMVSAAPVAPYDPATLMAGFPMDGFDYLNQWPGVDFGLDPNFLPDGPEFTEDSAGFLF